MYFHIDVIAILVSVSSISESPTHVLTNLHRQCNLNIVMGVLYNLSIKYTWELNERQRPRTRHLFVVF